MPQPAVLYYQVQGFQESSLSLLAEHFEVITRPEPGAEKFGAETSGDERAVALFAPMGYRYDGAFLDRFPHLQVIGTPTTGTMHIDETYAAARSITVHSLKDQQAFLRTITPTAELAWGLVIALTRHLLPAFDHVLAGGFDGKSFGRRTPRMLSTMRLGVVGLGRLGAWVAGYGAAFGMQVSYFDPYVDDPRSSIEYSRCSTPQDLAAQSDVVSLHVHSTPETRSMVDADFLAAMPQGSFLVNTARGDLVDEDALLAALESGHLAGAGLDMLAGDHEPGFAARLPEHPLMAYARAHDNLIVTPHYGGSTRDAWEVTEQQIIRRMAATIRDRMEEKGA